MKKKTKLICVLVVLILPVMSLGKYALYELSGAASTLRSSIGKTVVVPKQEFNVLGRTITSGPLTGTLEEVNYRWNDSSGFFDLKVVCSGGSTSLSPFEAMDVKVLDSKQASPTDIEQTFDKSTRH